MRRSPGADDLISVAVERVAAGDSAGAIASIRAAAAVEPDSAMAAMRMAEIDLQLSGSTAARRWLDRLAALGERSEPAAFVLAQIAAREAAAAAAGRRFVDAMRLFRGALALNPSDDSSLLQLGNIAEPASDRLSFLPRSLAIRAWAGPCINLGNIAKGANSSTVAIRWYRKAIALEPSHSFAWNNLATTERDRAEIATALAAYRRAVTSDPAAAATESNLLQALQFDPGIDDLALARAHRRWAERHAARFTPASAVFANRPDPERRLTLGYVSPDFGRHPVGFFFLPIVEAHDRRTVRTICYATRTMADEVAAGIRAAADSWVDAGGLDDDALAEKIRGDGVDVLIDLSGHTAHHRLQLFARRPAPVQATWLGYFDTTGLGAINLALTDAWEVPASGEVRFAEHVVRLPSGRFAYRPPAYAPPPAGPPSSRTGAVTFGSFNNLGKLTDPVVRCWSHLLTRVPGARLVVKWASLEDPDVARRIAARFRAHGIDAHRLVFRGASPHDRMLAEYGDVDVALDPFPFSGCLTTVEALWMGVPVVTLAGGRPVARQSAAILSRIGLAEFIAADEDAYIRCAIDLANATPRRAALRSDLRSRMAAGGLLDGRAVAADAEVAFRDAWQHWCRRTAASGPA